MFDSEALAKAVHGDREMAALIKTAPQLDTPIITSALTTVEAWNPRDTSRQALWSGALSRIRIVHTDDHVISAARNMLQEAGLHGHKYAIDAVLAAVAQRESARGAETTVFTSDVDDMNQLLARHPVRVERI
ncbi:DNA-binding protein [Nocardia flavorosea]|uniref:DNA-binding protein n=1 Tax=Nocardia flavorosea TaxID=53429 RepID=UPI000B07195B|nr:DNA-binding protein [Nocardia flavorosea]